MGFISALKSLFSSSDTQEKKKETLTLETAAEFLKKHSKDYELEKQIANKENEIKSKAEEIKALLTKLESADMPKNIKESAYVETKVLGNRNAYISYVNILLRKLESREDFEKAFREFSQKSVKSYYATQYLFGKELKELAESIQGISKLFMDKSNLQDEFDTSPSRKLEKDIALLRATIAEKSRLKSEIEIIEKELKSTEPLSTERKYVELKNSEEYAVAVRNRENAEAIVRKNREAIVEFFSGIKRILKKSNNKKRLWLVQYYIDEPIEALLEDRELKLLDFLEGIRAEEIDENIGILKAVTKEKLSNLRLEYEASLESMKALEKNQDIEKRIYGLEDALFRLNSQRTTLQKKLDELKKKDEVNINELKKDIENSLIAVSGAIVELQG